MTQPVTYQPARMGGEKRIIPASTSTPRPAAMPSVSGPDLPLSKLTSLARALASEGPPVDHARIAQISRAIASGDYRIDALAIADAMLRRLPPPRP